MWQDSISLNRQSFLEINIELQFETTPREELILLFCADRGVPGRVVWSLTLVHFEELIEWFVGAGGGSSRVCMNILGVKQVPRSLDAVKRSLWQLMGLTADRWLCEREREGWREGERERGATSVIWHVQYISIFTLKLSTRRNSSSHNPTAPTHFRDTVCVCDTWKRTEQTQLKSFFRNGFFILCSCTLFSWQF